MIELNQQLGRATSMVTVALGPCATTWSEPVQHTRDLSGAPVLGDNALEALDTGHIVDQLCYGFLFNSNHTTKYVLGPFAVFGCSGRETCIQAWAYRVEFQGGKHRAAPGFAHRVFHGTGMPHRHIAYWANDKLKTGDLLRWMLADLPADFPSLASAVLKVPALNPEQKPQLSIRTVSSWMDDEPLLKHCEADEQAGVHPYLAPLWLVSCVPHKRVTGTQTKPRCRLYDKKWLHHQTNQHLGSNWLSEARCGFSAAVKYLIETGPSSAEMLNPLSTGSTFQLTERHQPIYSSKCFCKRNGDDSFSEVTPLSEHKRHTTETVHKTSEWEDCNRTGNNKLVERLLLCPMADCSQKVATSCAIASR